jgi:hypothetical protein
LGCVRDKNVDFVRVSSFLDGIKYYYQHTHRGAPKEGTAGLQPPSLTPQNRNLKNAYFVDITISKVLHDLTFRRNQPLKSADDYYVRILESKLIKLKEQEDRTL